LQITNADALPYNGRLTVSGSGIVNFDSGATGSGGLGRVGAGDIGSVPEPGTLELLVGAGSFAALAAGYLRRKRDEI
jgi:hypothetical protein